MHTFKMTEAQAELLFKVVKDQTSALKNWACSATESGKIEYAQELIKELREYEALYALFNMPAKRDIAKHTGKAMETEHGPRYANLRLDAKANG